MNISAKSQYACLAMLELAVRHGTGEPVRLRDIADVHNISSQFLVQILLQLKGSGLVVSARGAAGGYRLAREPSQINLADILAAVDARFAEPDRLGETSAPTASGSTLAEFWQGAAELQRDYLTQTTLGDLSERARSKTDLGMYYI